MTSVTFSVGGKAAGIDRKAPFTARVGTAGLPTRIKVAARVLAAGKTTVLTTSIARC